jgi:hypothetical protein
MATITTIPQEVLVEEHICRLMADIHKAIHRATYVKKRLAHQYRMIDSGLCGEIESLIDFALKSALKDVMDHLTTVDMGSSQVDMNTTPCLDVPAVSPSAPNEPVSSKLRIHLSLFHFYHRPLFLFQFYYGLHFAESQRLFCALLTAWSVWLDRMLAPFTVLPSQLHRPVCFHQIQRTRMLITVVAQAMGAIPGQWKEVIPAL